MRCHSAPRVEGVTSLNPQRHSHFTDEKTDQLRCGIHHDHRPHGQLSVVSLTLVALPPCSREGFLKNVAMLYFPVS